MKEMKWSENYNDEIISERNEKMCEADWRRELWPA